MPRSEFPQWARRMPGRPDPEFRARAIGAKAYDAMRDRVAHRAPFLRGTPWLRARRRRDSPCLTTGPLIRWDEKSKYLDRTHWVSHKIVAPETAVLLHFKFLKDFHARAVEEAARGEYYDEASEYQRYERRLAKNPDLTLMGGASMGFEGTTQLVRLGLMQDTEAWADARAKTR